MVSIFGVREDHHDLILWACDHLTIPNSISLIFDYDDLSHHGDHGELQDYSLEDQEFYLSIEETLDMKDAAVTIFHEMYHIRQVLDGRLNFECGPTIWLGEKYRVLEGDTYGMLPWEKEAFFMEQKMLEHYLLSDGCML